MEGRSFAAVAMAEKSVFESDSTEGPPVQSMTTSRERMMDTQVDGSLASPMTGMTEIYVSYGQ